MKPLDTRAPSTTSPGALAPRCSVVLCTLGSNPGLPRAVTAVLAQRDVDLELVVVDNDPTSGRTASVLQQHRDPRVRRVSEYRRGLSAARNAGVRAAQGQVLVFTDDDCTPAPGWLRAVLAVMDLHPAVAAVTGRTVPDSHSTPVQELFEEFGSFNRGLDRRVWRYPSTAGPRPAELAELGLDGEAPPVFPYSAVYGSGNNMALRADVLRRVGPFDEALGAGSPAAGGEDLDMFVRLMLAGLVLVYEPAAVVTHTHRSDLDTLTSQVQGYGSGLAAMLTKYLLASSESRGQVLRRTAPGLRLLLGPQSPKNSRKSASYPRTLTRSELVGIALGPWLYLRGRRALRRSGRPASGGVLVLPAEVISPAPERAVA